MPSDPRINWKEIAELVGIFAIVASLLFVGLQMRQEQQIAIVESRSSLTERNIALAELVNANAEVWRNGLDGAELSSDEQTEFDAMAEAVRIHYNTVVHQVEANWTDRSARCCPIVRIRPVHASGPGAGVAGAGTHGRSTQRCVRIANVQCDRLYGISERQSQKIAKRRSAARDRPSICILVEIYE